MPAPPLLSALLLLPLVAAPSAPADPALAVNLLPAQVKFEIAGQAQPFVGVVLLSASPDLAHYFVGLPPLLADALVIAYGVGDARGYQVTFPDVVFPAGVLWHAQGVTIDERGIHASNTASFVLDQTGVDR